MSQRPRVPTEEIARVKVQLQDKEAKLMWALDFAQTDLAAASAGWWTDTQVTLAALTGAGRQGRGDQSEVLTKEEIQDVQRRFARHLEEWVSKRRVTLGRARQELWIGLEPGPGGEEVAGLQFALMLPRPDTFSPDRVAFDLALLLVPIGTAVRECQAPKAWGEAGEQCGRWFLGRPNRRYCSLTCQSRAGARAARSAKAR